jgi:hypothetical protein
MVRTPPYLLLTESLIGTKTNHNSTLVVSANDCFVEKVCSRSVQHSQT